MGAPGVPWDPMGSHGISWGPLGSPGVPWDPRGSPGIPPLGFPRILPSVWPGLFLNQKTIGIIRAHACGKACHATKMARKLEKSKKPQKVDGKKRKQQIDYKILYEYEFGVTGLQVRKQNVGPVRPPSQYTDVACFILWLFYVFECV